MATVTLDQEIVSNGSLELPYRGAWWADLELAGNAIPSGSVTLSIDDAQYAGTVVTADAVDGHVEARIVGGSGGLSGAIESRNFRAVTALDVLTYVLGEAESLSSTVAPAVTGYSLPHWTVAAGAISDALSTLAESIGATWHVLADGTIWIGDVTWSDSGPILDPITSEQATVDAVTVGVSRVSILPGTIRGGRRVSRVSYALGSGGLRAKVWFTDSASDRLWSALNSMIQRATRSLAYSYLYPATVAGQSGDRLDLTPDDDRIRGLGLQGVPIWTGSPGSVTLPAGARVLVGFRNADPSLPFAVAHNGDALTELSIGSGADYVSLDLKVRAAIDAAIAGHTHSGVVPGPSSTGPGTGSPAGSTAALKTKAE